MKLKAAFTIALLAGSTGLSSGQFVPAFGDDQLPLNQPCEVTVLDGKVYQGKLKSAMQSGGKLKWFSIALDDGTGRKKFTAEEVTLVKMKPSNLHKIAEAVNSAQNVAKIKDIKSIIDCDWIYYETVTMGKKDKSYLMQRLNPGKGNSKLKAYVDPNAKQESSFELGGMTLVGGKDKSYFLVADGGNKAVLAEKKHYKKQMPEIFTGCASFFSTVKQDTDWDNFPWHVTLYNYTCE